MKISNLEKGIILSVICIGVILFNYYNYTKWTNLFLSMVIFYLGFGTGWNYRSDYQQYIDKKADVGK